MGECQRVASSEPLISARTSTLNFKRGRDPRLDKAVALFAQLDVDRIHLTQLPSMEGRQFRFEPSLQSRANEYREVNLTACHAAAAREHAINQLKGAVRQQKSSRPRLNTMQESPSGWRKSESPCAKAVDVKCAVKDAQIEQPSSDSHNLQPRQVCKNESNA